MDSYWPKRDAGLYGGLFPRAHVLKITCFVGFSKSYMVCRYKAFLLFRINVLVNMHVHPKDELFSSTENINLRICFDILFLRLAYDAMLAFVLFIMRVVSDAAEIARYVENNFSLTWSHTFSNRLFKADTVGCGLIG